MPTQTIELSTCQPMHTPSITEDVCVPVSSPVLPPPSPLGLAGTTYMYIDLLSGVQESRFPALELPVVKNPINLTVHSLTT